MRRINLKKASVARSDTIRNINRQIVLNYVRERAPISRAAISHETDLQRSTWTGRRGGDVTRLFQRLQGRARVILVDVGQDGLTNTAVTNVALHRLQHLSFLLSALLFWCPPGT